jgi:hypothetical protein
MRLRRTSWRSASRAFAAFLARLIARVSDALYSAISSPDSRDKYCKENGTHHDRAFMPSNPTPKLALTHAAPVSLVMREP